ncbi:hypothetical protein CAPTEDRAFT_212347, partial [Capitella teleta]
MPAIHALLFTLAVAKSQGIVNKSVHEPTIVEYTDDYTDAGYNSRLPTRRSPLDDKTLRIGLLSRWSTDVKDSPLGAVSLAIQRAREEGLLADFNITLLPRSTECDGMVGTEGVISLQWDDDVDVLVGPYCPA